MIRLSISSYWIIALAVTGAASFAYRYFFETGNEAELYCAGAFAVLGVLYFLLIKTVRR